VKEVYGSAAEEIEYAGSLQVGGIVGIVCFVLLEILTPETRRRDGTLHCSRKHPVSLQMDRQDTDMKATHQNVTTKLCLASHSISFAVDIATLNTFIEPILISRTHTTTSPHHAIQQLLDIRVRIRNIIVRGELVPVEDRGLKFSRRLIASDAKEQLLVTNRVARVANDACAEEFLAKRYGYMSLCVRVQTIIRNPTT